MTITWKCRCNTCGVYDYRIVEGKNPPADGCFYCDAPYATVAVVQVNGQPSMKRDTLDSDRENC